SSVERLAWRGPDRPRKTMVCPTPGSPTLAQSEFREIRSSEIRLGFSLPYGQMEAAEGALRLSNRRSVLSPNPHNLHNATDFALNAPCLCNSGKKFNECCLLEILSGAA
ncbi:MAG: SEC-C metal-binding domain-containing protein, partial [Bryobacteraceae bacterium]